MTQQERDMDMERDEMDEAPQEEGSESTSSSGRGFASMDPEKQREIARKGGMSQGKENNPANFANDREKAAAAGRIGGQHSRGGGRSSTEEQEE